MKNIGRILKPVMILGLFLGLSLAVMSQGPPPPPPSGHGATGNLPPEGGTAPIGSGVALLLGLGAAWGTRKMVIANREEE